MVDAARHAIDHPQTFTVHSLDEASARQSAAPVRPRLSPREREVLALVVDGLATRQIATRLFISESTAKTHVANLYVKLGAGNRVQAVMIAIRLDLLTDEPTW